MLFKINLKSNSVLALIFTVFCSVLLLKLCSCDDTREELRPLSSALDGPVLRPFFHQLREAIFNIVARTSSMPRRYGKSLQEPFPPNADFPCPLRNMVSREIPKSVHQLRPGDIKVIMAMGDSLTVAYGAVAQNVLETTLENRGMSFSIGGQWDWRNLTTLPNILRKFNPNLIGYATGDGLPFQSVTQFNMGEIAALTNDMPFMAKILIERVKNHPRIDFKNDWKLLTLTIGGNDLCTYICHLKRPDKFIESYRKYLKQTLDYLRDNLPRTFVNLVAIPKLYENLRAKNKPKRCAQMQLFLCSCWVGSLYNQTNENLLYYRSIQLQMEQVQEELAYKYRGLDSFTVIYQPFTVNYKITNSKGVSDFSLTSFDCFHMSQKGNAWAGTSLWNNMLEMPGFKSKTMTDPLTKFLCPTEDNPYFFTYDNY